MSLLFTRPQFREQVRHLLQIVTPFDKGLGNVGDQPPWSPSPSNSTINENIQNAITDVNREVGLHINIYPVPVAAVSPSILGPFALSLADLTPNTSASTVVSPTALINDIQRVLWTPTSSVPILLNPSNRNQLDKGINSYYANAPGTPQTYFVEGYTLYVTPAPFTTGTLTITAGTGISGLQTEVDTLDQVPVEYQQVFLYQTIVRLSKLSTLDVEAQERAAMFAPDAQQGILRFKAWKDGGTGPTNPQVAIFTYRSGYGCRRTRR